MQHELSSAMALHQQSPLLSVKSIISLFVTLLLSLTVFDYGALASPVSNQLSKRYTGDVDPTVSPNYPTDDEIRAAYITSNQPTVFYSNIGPPDAAQQFAASINGRLLRDAFPDGYTKYNQRGKTGYQNFIDRCSGILADNAAGQVYFVGQQNGFVDRNRVWARVEYVSLQANGQVTQITLVNKDDFTETSPYNGLNTKVKRDGGYSFDWDGDIENPLGNYSDT